MAWTPVPEHGHQTARQLVLHTRQIAMGVRLGSTEIRSEDRRFASGRRRRTHIGHEIKLTAGSLEATQELLAAFLMDAAHAKYKDELGLQHYFYQPSFRVRIAVTPKENDDRRQSDRTTHASAR